MPYPDYPRSLTADATEVFTGRFERAYRFNGFLANFGDQGYEEASVTGGVPDWAVFERPNGYIVGVNVTVKFSDTDTPTPPEQPAPSGELPSSAWYYLTDRFALRSEYRESQLVEGRDTPELEGTATIVCNES